MEKGNGIEIGIESVRSEGDKIGGYMYFEFLKLGDLTESVIHYNVFGADF